LHLLTGIAKIVAVAPAKPNATASGYSKFIRPRAVPRRSGLPSGQ
jgi:hypothetical protein